MKDNIFLTGFSGTGKTSTAAALAKMLGYDYIDTDQLIERQTGRKIAEIFAEDGEEAFRRLEKIALEEVAKGDYQVISTGGGIVLSKANRTEMVSNGYVVCLDAYAETIYVRLLLDTTPTDRPLLQAEDQFERIQKLKIQRAPFYAEADWTIHTDFLTPAETAAEVEHALQFMRRRSITKRGEGHPVVTTEQAPLKDPRNPLIVKTTSGTYPVLFGNGLLGQIATLLQEYVPEVAGRAIFIISDSQVGEIYGKQVTEALAQTGYRVALKTVPAGEESKSLTQVAALYDWLRAERAERKDLILALGGGVVGDLAGFVAATWLRGIPFVQVPTTVLAMVDSSVGGKTGVNLPQGKNLVGAFYQPRLVIADVSTLASLPDRVRRSGWAEVIKHAIIPGADPDEQGALRRFTRLEEFCDRLMVGEPEITAEILRESVAVKAGVVAIDERETGLRITLNYGHTIGHALEAASGYTELLHGEGIAIGMHGVALLSQQLGLCDATFVERQRHLLERFGLPLSAPPNLDSVKALAALHLDKKSEAGSVRWILPRDLGRVEIRRDLPATAVEEVLLSRLNDK
ncbi:MAG: 3-dehydroquinate synthase [Chloroflexota bacterium]